jgi:hypothetical protein
VKKGQQKKPAQLGTLQSDIEVGVVVDNPYHSPSHPTSSTNPLRIPVTRNRRESGISELAAKGALNSAQVAAADKFRALFEAMGGAGARAIDPAKECVDGGRIPDPISTRAFQAGVELKKAAEHLTRTHGEYGYRLVRYVAGEGRRIPDLTETKRQRLTMVDNLRMYLDALAEFWGFQTKQRRAG